MNPSCRSLTLTRRYVIELVRSPRAVAALGIGTVPAPSRATPKVTAVVVLPVPNRATAHEPIRMA